MRKAGVGGMKRMNDLGKWEAEAEAKADMVEWEGGKGGRACWTRLPPPRTLISTLLGRTDYVFFSLEPPLCLFWGGTT